MNELKRLKLDTIDKLKQKLLDYKRECHGLMTFRGFLAFCEINTRVMKDLLTQVAIEEDQEVYGKYSKIYDWLENIKLKFEAHLESYLIYQRQHPDLKNQEYFNYDNIKFILKSSNKSVYDSAKSAETMVINSKTSVSKIPSNKSGIKLWAK